MDQDGPRVTTGRQRAHCAPGRETSSQSPSELRAWSEAARFPLALLNETVVVGAGLLVPVVLALWRVWGARENAAAAIGLALITTLWLGGAHMISLVAAATTCLGFALVRTGRLRRLGVAGLVAAASQVLLAYAWLLPPGDPHPGSERIAGPALQAPTRSRRSKASMPATPKTEPMATSATAGVRSNASIGTAPRCHRGDAPTTASGQSRAGPMIGSR